MQLDTQDTFEAYRPRLFSIAYRMLGERAAAADIVQEAALRWHTAEQGGIANPYAWLRQTTTRLAIDALRRLAHQREAYIGPWLAEPFIERSTDTDEPAAQYALAQQCELALLWAMERLAPEERAAFILHEAFEVPYADIADTLDKTPAAVRQLVSRAKKRVHSSGPRFDAPAQQAQDLMARFAAATVAQDNQGVMDLLAPDAVALSDGGGKARAALRVLEGPREIAAVLINVSKKYVDPAALESLTLNGQPGFGILQGGERDMVCTMVPNEAGQIQWIYLMRNPDKL